MGDIKALLLMAGKGARFKSPLPKQFHRVAGKKIYIHTLEKFLASQLFNEIILVCTREWVDEVKREVAALPVRVVAGGETRQESSYLGLLAAGKETQLVVIHDAVRPFVTEKILRENIEACKIYGAVDTCVPSADTLIKTVDGTRIDTIPQRDQFLRGQTPQTFSYPLILEAHEQARRSDRIATDDCSLVMALGKEVKIVPGDEANIKITTDLDLYLAEQLFRRAETITGRALRDLRGKQFAITGGTGDIGQAIAELLEQKGARTLLLSRSSSIYPVDLTSAEQTATTFEKIFHEHGMLDGVVNCVGKLLLKRVDQLTPQEIESEIATNLSSVIFACKYAKIKKGGEILNISSSAYSRGRAGYAVYSAAKAAVVNFTQALAEERSDLRVNVLVPQRTQTRLRSLYFPHEEQGSRLTPKHVAESAVAVLQESSGTGLIFDVRHSLKEFANC